MICLQVLLREALCDFFFSRKKKNIINLAIVSLISFSRRYSFSPFSSYPFSPSLGSRVIVLRYGLEHYLVQSPLGSSWVWKDSSTSVLWNGIIRTISRRNPFTCLYSLFHHEPNFILSPTSLSEGMQPMLSLYKIMIFYEAHQHAVSSIGRKLP